MRIRRLDIVGFKSFMDRTVVAFHEGVTGVVKAQAVIRGGSVREVTILSGPKILHGAVRNAMLQYKCVASDGEIVATQQFVFEAE